MYKVKKYYTIATTAKKAQETFERYCEDLKAGKVKRPKDLPEDIVISPDTFKMCYADLPEDNIFHKCRAQMPIQWFISENGIVLHLNKDYPEVLKDNSSKEERRSDNEKQYKISNATRYPFQRRTIIKDKQGNIQYEEDGITPKTKRATKTLMNYALVAIIYASEGRTIALLDDKLKENIKKYGLESFGKPNKGHTKKTAKTEEAEEEEEEKVTSLIIDGEEVISSDDMLVVHHVKEGYAIDPDLLEIMPNWLHKEIDIMTASATTIEEEWRILEKSDRATDWLNYVYPNGCNILIYAVTIGKDGKPNKYIYHSKINEDREDKEYHSKNRYFKIVPIETDSEKVTEEVIKLIQLQEDNKEALNLLNLDNGIQGFIAFDVMDKDKELHRFYISYDSGDKEYFKNYIKRLRYNLPLRRKVYDLCYEESKEKGEVFIVQIGSSDCYAKIYLNIREENAEND